MKMMAAITTNETPPRTPKTIAKTGVGSVKVVNEIKWLSKCQEINCQWIFICINLVICVSISYCHLLFKTKSKFQILDQYIYIIYFNDNLLMTKSSVQTYTTFFKS